MNIWIKFRMAEDSGFLKTLLLVWVFCFCYACSTSSKLQRRTPADDDNKVIVKKMISPGYYSQECNAHKRCKDPTKYCHMFLCVDCLKENVACTQNGQCCPGSECVYGRCKSGAAAGQAGAFCDRQSDCKDPDLCCVRESAINPAISICKPALDEHQTCGPYNQYRTLYIGGTVQPPCGPCKQGLTCKQVGIFGVHQVCLPEASSAPPSGGK